MGHRSRYSRPTRIEVLERRDLLASSPLHNVRQPLDVNDDGMVTPMDALLCINRINEQPANSIVSLAAGPKRPRYMDVDRDGIVSSTDVRLVINKLNRGSSAESPARLPPRSIDGSGNNPENADWGMAGAELLRVSLPAYADGRSTPGGEERPSPRIISNAVSAQTTEKLNARRLSSMVWQWGQFLDHDISLTPAMSPVEPLAIDVPPGDPHFDPHNTGSQTIGLNRSIYDDAVPDFSREQLNLLTSFIDGSNVYGADSERAQRLRTLSGGRLKTSDSGLLPFNDEGLPNDGGSDATFFVAGDVRANEQVGLIALHTLFVREHNRLADEFSANDPSLSDEELYQRARAIVVAELQAITYNEFIPALLGIEALEDYSGYDDTINPGISNLFSTAAYRFGHSMLPAELLRLDEAGQPIAAGHIALRDAFFAPDEIVQHGIEPVLRGLVHQQAQEIDTQVVDDVRNFLFGPPGAGGFDLASLNIQRGRDHGLPAYSQLREDYGLASPNSFTDVTSDVALAAALEDVYAGDVDQIDPWVGFLAEDHVAGASVGPLAFRVLADQFHRLRDGDQYWYQRMFSGAELAELEQTTLARVIQRNTSVSGLPSNVFFYRP